MNIELDLKRAFTWGYTPEELLKDRISVEKQHLKENLANTDVVSILKNNLGNCLLVFEGAQNRGDVLCKVKSDDKKNITLSVGCITPQDKLITDMTFSPMGSLEGFTRSFWQKIDGHYDTKKVELRYEGSENLGVSILKGVNELLGILSKIGFKKQVEVHGPGKNRLGRYPVEYTHF